MEITVQLVHYFLSVKILVLIVKACAIHFCNKLQVLAIYWAKVTYSLPCSLYLNLSDWLADGTGQDFASCLFIELFEGSQVVTWAILWVSFLFLVWKSWSLYFWYWCAWYFCFLVINQLSTVVLCPLSVTDGWVSEMEKFAPKLKVLRYVGDKEYRRILRRTIYEHVKEESSSSSNVSSGPVV